MKLAEKTKDRRGGARPGAGRSSKASILGLNALLDKCWTVEDREECISKLSSLAKEGNLDAMKLLMNYAFGRPREVKEHTGLDGAPIKHEIRVHYIDRPIDPAK